ncbi:hypothetical protein PROFUN_10151 [Planoprotostelium fungivorum]|uniref:Uncharacterized protein n=1 Tax=Planoprotostelium fungivorum TaxID=1890364 RepID=A0A2P6NEM1_9EUKA|nr:hypothetical protein PROFUN_10151 [Planoprotostelium fungivorum]
MQSRGTQRQTEAVEQAKRFDDGDEYKAGFFKTWTSVSNLGNSD